MTRYLSIAGVALALAGGLWFHGNYHGRKVMQLKIEQANNRALEEKQRLQEKIDDITQNQADRLADIIAERDAALEQLRQRPDRVPEAATTECQGATGAELSRPDAEFLTREAARADQLRQALKSCYDYADKLQE